jgi:hypothetical protein
LIFRRNPSAPSEAKELEITEVACSNKSQLAELRAANGPVNSGVPGSRDASLMIASCLALGNCEHIRVFEISASSQTLGWLVGVREIASSVLRLGPLVLFRYRQPRLRFLGDYGFVPRAGWFDEEAVASLVLRLSRMMRGEAIYLQAVDRSSLMSGVVARLSERGTARVCTEYPERVRHRLNPAASFDSHLQSRSKNTRQTFRYSVKKLRDHCAGDMVLEVYETPAEIENFANDAAKVAEKTYQQRRLGLGFTNASSVKARLRLAAEFGWAKSFILRCRGEAVAYIEGYQAGGTFVAYQIGFLPEWSKWSAGTVCQLEAIKYLMDAAPVRPQAIDYLEGDSDFKRRICNVSSTETGIWVFTRINRTAALFYIQMGLNAIFRVIRPAAKSLVASYARVRSRFPWSARQKPPAPGLS